MNEYTVKEIAAKTGTSKETVRRWIRSGQLKAKKDPKTGEIIISENDINEFIEKKPKYSYLVGKQLVAGGAAMIASGAAGLGIGSALILSLLSAGLIGGASTLKKELKTVDDNDISPENLNDIAIRLIKETENKIKMKENEIEDLQLKVKKAQLELEAYEQELIDLKSYIQEQDN